MNLRNTVSSVAIGLLFCPAAFSGTFIFAESNDSPNIITHPTGYNGSGGTLSISVCIATDSENQSDLEIPVQNTISTWNTFEPTKTNVTRNDSELGSNQFDVESVLLHEVGHCIGLGHPNLGNLEGVATENQDFAMTLKGTNDAYDLNNGADNVKGSNDDIRGDDVNLNWFRIGENDPFLFESEIDLDTYSNDTSNLPGSHSWVEIAAFEVSQLHGEGSGEGVMNQGTLNQETQRSIHPEDATTIRIGMSGLDENQDTGDDYNFELVYGGIADNCDITIEMKGNGFGVCNVNGSGIGGSHVSITSGTITLGSTSEFNWFFNDTLTGGVVFEDRFEE